MSQHNELQRYPALQRAYPVAVGMDPREEGVTRLGETLTPIIDLWSRDEWAFLFDEILWADVSALVAAGGAGLFSKWQLAVAPGFLLTIERIVNTAPATNLNVTLVTPPQTGGAWAVGPDPRFRDSRWGPSTAIVRQVISSVENATGSAGTINFVLGNQGSVLDKPIILDSSTALIIEPTTANVALPFGIPVLGRVRRLSPEELNG